jgi:2-iminobutanoate/2-iminopropanoate deaminase
LTRTEFINPSGFGPSLAPYSQGARVGNLLFIAGQVGLDEENNVVTPGEVGEQTRVSIDRMRRVLAEVGGDLTDIVAATVYLTDMADFGAFNEAWSEQFGDHRPARAAVRADLALAGLVVEIQAIAALGE